jgi:hypothetical protein
MSKVKNSFEKSAKLNEINSMVNEAIEGINEVRKFQK